MPYPYRWPGPERPPVEKDPQPGRLTLILTSLALGIFIAMGLLGWPGAGA